MLYFAFAPFGIQKPVSEYDLSIAAIETTLNEFSIALSTADTVSLKRLTGPTFVLLEEGQTFDFQTMISSIEQFFANGAKMNRLPSSFHIELRGSVAWSTYRVTGEFENSEGTIPLSLLEAAVLEKHGKQWRIVQMTTIPATAK